MKFCLFIALIIIFCLKSTNAEGGFFESLLQGITLLKNVSDTKQEKKDDEEQNIVEENIYEMKTFEQFDLNMKINGTKEENALIILFYSPNCIHCKHFLPIYREISEALKNDTTLKFSKIQNTYIEEILKKYTQIKVAHVPTLILYQKGRYIRYEGTRTKEKVIKFIYQIKDFYCQEIATIDQLSSYINPKIIFSQDIDKHFILGIFKENEHFDKNYILEKLVDFIYVYSDIIVNKKCYYFFKNDNISINDIDKNNIYLRHVLKGKDNEINDFQLYSYHYHKGFNTFPLFNAYLQMQKNLTKIDDDFKSANVNNNKISKIIKNKFKLFLDENYLPKYFSFNDPYDAYNTLNEYERKMFIFYYETEELKKFYIDEINYIFSLNHSINSDYLFTLFNTTNTKVDKKKRLTFISYENFDNIVLLKEGEINKTSVESKILEYIDKDRKHEIKSETAQALIKNILGWITDLEKKLNNTKPRDIEKELIDEINKTIIEDEKAQKLKQEKQKNESDVEDKKNIEKRRKILESFKNEDLGFNKNLLVFPIILIIYSFLYFLCYKYILSKYDIKILYNRLPTDDPKNK